MIEWITELSPKELGRLRKRDLEKALTKILELLPSTSPTIELKLVKSEEMRRLNKTFRQKDKATDVLSFPFHGKDLLGSIVIDVETARIQAKEYGHSFEEEILELFVHGVLHLLGMNHESQPEADLMKFYEDFISRQLSRRTRR